MTALLLALSLAVAAPQPFALADAGVTLQLPQPWKMTRWSDYDFKAKSADGALNMFLWTTPWQVDVDAANAEIWAGRMAAQMKDEGFDEARVDSFTVKTLGGRPTSVVKLTLTSKSKAGLNAVLYGATITGAGQNIHFYVLSLERFGDRAERAMEEIASSLVLDRAPLDIGSNKVATKAGFEATLPAGWRVPLEAELGYVLAVTSKMGHDQLPPESCWVAVRPPADGEPDIMFACEAALYLSPVDEHSFAGVEPEVHNTYFKDANPPVPAAVSVPVGDRVGFYFQPPREKGPLRLAVAPFGAGKVMRLLAVGNHIDAAAMDADAQAVLASTVFTGPNGGKPQIGVDRWVGYYLKYRTFSPVVLGPLVVLIGALALVVRALRGKPAQPEA